MEGIQGIKSMKEKKTKKIKTIIFVTGNKFKLAVSQKYLKPIKVLGKKINNLPEIQHHDVREIAKFSAQLAANKLNKPLIVSDAGFYIESLNGFPGPYIRFCEEHLGVDGFLKLMQGIKNRKAKFIDATVFCEPGKEPIVFVGETKGKIAYQKSGKYGWGVDSIFIPDGQNKTMASFPNRERINLWNNKRWKQLSKFLLSRG